MRRCITMILAAAAAAASFSCAESEMRGPAFYYALAKEFSTGAVVESTGTALCDRLDTAACEKARETIAVPPGGDGPETQLIPDGCACAGSFTVSDGHTEITFPGAARAGASLTTWDGGVYLYSVDDRGYCIGSLTLSKAGALDAGDGAHYPDLAGAYEARCASRDIRRGVFYLVPKEAVPGKSP